jgi:hypothetical protein
MLHGPYIAQVASAAHVVAPRHKLRSMIHNSGLPSPALTDVTIACQKRSHISYNRVSSLVSQTIALFRWLESLEPKSHVVPLAFVVICVLHVALRRGAFMLSKRVTRVLVPDLGKDTFVNDNPSWSPRLCCVSGTSNNPLPHRRGNTRVVAANAALRVQNGFRSQEGHPPSPTPPGGGLGGVHLLRAGAIWRGGAAVFSRNASV